MSEPLLIELEEGRSGTLPASCLLPECDVPQAELPWEMVRQELPLPEVSEVDLVRHYVRLSQLNYAVDKGLYPLGSCTMKYNPKVNEETARLQGFVQTHPYQDELTVQGNLQLLWELQEFLREIGGFAGVSLQPAAGAQGELAGVLMIRAYHRERGDAKRQVMLIPDSAHGTNPASTSMSGYTTVEIKSDSRGNVDLEDLRAHCDDRVAGMMLTNPNTLGLFDEHVLQVAELVHSCGGLLYGDGANMNALLGIVKPGALGIDVLHYNLHKTFSTPHGGGGPGAGPVAVAERLVRYLPGPIVARYSLEDLPEIETEDGEEEPQYVYHLVMPEASIGRLKSFYGNFGVLVRAYTYICMLGAQGLREVSENAVLNANYLLAKLRGVYPLPYDRRCMHEFVFSGKRPETPEIHTLDIAKRLMDYGYHPPTIYFPLIVPEALMIEPTETESKRTLDAFIEAMRRIAEEAVAEPQLLHDAPHDTPVRRLDEVRAARQPKLRW
ncbi:MAG: aminomethyl-transferring glycine dehydrogenase subunit GcvPB [Chloroflexi bacterium]|nr:aminomethyl-transferring glycine dehydrogenase subunit GcvPB [Chloroflexota bacterium]